jgi:carboxylesterase
MKDRTNIWEFQGTLSKRLLVWAAGSTLSGLSLVVSASGFWDGFGIQALAWGVIDGLIAGLGLWLSRRRRRTVPNAGNPQVMEQESRKLKRTLWINTGLDLLYIAGGMVLAATLGRTNAAWRGHGWGIILQGAFLFFFDLIHAQSVPPGLLSQPLKAFSDPVHQPFLLGGGNAAALLVHGFPGTPAEMRPLAELLHDQGWTVQGILLPGFGSRFAEILELGYTDWLEAVEQALQTLRQKYSPVLLIGYSMGGALSLGATLQHQPDALVLLSPFWRLGTPLQRLIAQLLRPFLPRYFRPLEKADLNDPQLAQFLRDSFPDINMNDPGVQDWLRSLQVPISVVDQILKAGKQGYRSARSIGIPTLVIQGTEDALVRPRHTRLLARRLAAARPQRWLHDGPSSGGITRYLEIPGGHNIIDRDQPGWERLEQALVEFSRSVKDGERKRT